MKRLRFGIVLLSALLTGCKSAEIGGLNGLSLSAQSSLAPPPAQNVVASVTVTNISANQITLNYGGCGPVTAVLHTGSKDGPVAYDPRPTQICPAIANTKTLNPLESVTFNGSAVPSPALAPGTYYVEAITTLNGASKSLGAGIVTF